VKKHVQPSHPVGKKYSGPLLVNAVKAKDFQKLLYIPAVNLPFYINLRTDDVADKQFVLDDLCL
jgi:hypothetical protein